mmetsp:Transcript_7540/g.14771  ORF Transcript_7540/g.14771 Transcript_7540/m.14771 type:complete len:257 (-) Transcript_7540:1419-2189(-)
MGVDCAQGVVHKVHVCGAVEGTCELDACFLPAREVDSALPDLRLAPGGELCDVGAEAGRVDGNLVLLTVVRAAKQNVVLYCLIADPRRLGHVGERPPPLQGAGDCFDLPEDGGEERGLAAAHLADDDDELPPVDGEVYVVQVGGPGFEHILGVFAQLFCLVLLLGSSLCLLANAAALERCGCLLLELLGLGNFLRPESLRLLRRLLPLPREGTPRDSHHRLAHCHFARRPSYDRFVFLLFQKLLETVHRDFGRGHR